MALATEVKEHGRIQADPAGLDHVLDIIKRLKGDGGFLGSQNDWLEEMCPFTPIRLIHDPSQSLFDRIACEKATKAKEALEHATAALDTMLTHVSQQLKKCKARINSNLVRQGLLRLPDEALSIVLENAAVHETKPCKYFKDPNELKDRNDDGLKTVRAAVRLSHVCRRFRDVLIHTPRPWEDISNGMGSGDMVFTCLSRCGRGNGRIDVKTSFGSKRSSTSRDSGRFLRIVLEKTENWGCFVFDTDLDRFGCEDDFKPEQIFAELPKDLHLSNLNCLSITNSWLSMKKTFRDNPDSHSALHFYSSWAMPNLRVLTTRNLIPSAIQNFCSLESLSLVLNYDPTRTRARENLELDNTALIALLSVCTNLEKIGLRISGAKHTNSSQISAQRLCMPNISIASLWFEMCSREPVLALFNALSFPNATHMKLDIISSECGEAKLTNMSFSDIFSAIFPSPDAFPKLEDLKFKAFEGYYYTESGSRLKGVGSISIPFESFSKLKHLFINSVFTGINPLPIGISLPALRTLTLYECSKIDKIWLVDFLRQMDRQGNLEGLSIVVGGWCSGLRDAGIQGVLSSEALRELAAGQA